MWSKDHQLRWSMMFHQPCCSHLLAPHWANKVSTGLFVLLLSSSSLNLGLCSPWAIPTSEYVLSSSDSNLGLCSLKRFWLRTSQAQWSCQNLCWIWEMTWGFAPSSNSDLGLCLDSMVTLFVMPSSLPDFGSWMDGISNDCQYKTGLLAKEIEMIWTEFLQCRINENDLNTANSNDR